MSEGPFFIASVRVRYAETDAMGVAHHSAYIPWFELARIEVLRQLGHSYAELERTGVGMPVIELNVTYRRSVRFDDELVLKTRIALSGPSRITFTTDVLFDDKVCAIGTVMVASVGEGGRPIRVPSELAAVLSEDECSEV